MPEPRVSHIPRLSQSSIPVLAPRPTANVPTNSMPSHLVGMVPPSMHLSVSGSPSHPPSSPSGSTHSSTGGGLTPFRSFRNLLSFGPGKQTNSNANTTGPRSPFSSLAAIRRSMHGERSVSSPQLRQERFQDEHRVLSIDSASLPFELPKPMHEPLMSSAELRISMGLDVEHSALDYSRSTSLSSLPPNNHPVPPSAPVLGASDLSTILESELSGISKHVPTLDDSQDSHFEAVADLDPDVSHQHSPPKSKDISFEVPESPATSVLDLSTSQLTNEVLEALSETRNQKGWLHTVVVDDATDMHNVSAMGDIDPDESFNLKSFDHDLATILGPNRMDTTVQRPKLPVTPPASADGFPNTLMPPTSLSSPPSPLSSSNTVRTNPSPPRRVATLAKSSAPNLPSSLSNQRLARSASDRPSVLRPRQLDLPPPLIRHAMGRAQSHSPERPSTTSRIRPEDNSHQPRVSPSPVLSGPDASKPSLSRLVTAARASERHSTSSSRPTLARTLNASPSNRDRDLASPGSRPPSSAGRAPSRLQHPRPSLDSGMDRTRSSRLHARDRSASFTDSRLGPPFALRPPAARSAADWLGPRAAQAVRTAASLTPDKDTRAPSRFGSSRSSIDHESRSRYTPSRMAFSEAGSSSSWGRHSESASRTPALSDAVSSPALTESISTPRSVFSGRYAGPSPSVASSGAPAHSEFHHLQEKHSLETGVLLNALADSQRTTRVLREENSQLRERLQELEDRLSSALSQLHHLQQARPSSKLSVPSQRMLGTGPPASPTHSEPPHTHTQRYIYPDYLDSDSPSSEPVITSSETPLDGDLLTKTERRRYSATSSLFPAPPSNMSMIMHEEDIPDYVGGYSHRSTSPSSLTMVGSKLNALQNRTNHHAPNQSTSSAGNISPTTANFSMLTGSPKSLLLRPEHERHLGDMASLDLCAEDLDVGLYDDGLDS